jgi:DNA-directed RNA polymerase alpha subunit
MPHGHEPRPGPIEGLRLSARVWKILRRENIRTLDQLKASADQLERFEEIGPKTAQQIRQEIARVTSLAEQTTEGEGPPHP